MLNTRLIRPFALVGFLYICLPIQAQSSIFDAAAEPTVRTESIIDPVDLEAFVDGLIEARMDSFDVAGVTISIVHDNRVILAKGYGQADAQGRRPVSADDTLFRVGSISKTFTWTAVMQLVEQGKLDLDADIRDHLDDIDIPDTYAEPITLKHLLTHTPGFEDSALGHLFAKNADDSLPLEEYLKRYQPARVRPPGVLPSYSNYGTGLAGQIVANVSGMRFEDYVEMNIFEPLCMSSSTFREPIGEDNPDSMPADLVARSSAALEYKGGAFKTGGFEYIGHIGPAGSMSTTSIDMARWMLAHLGTPSCNGADVLKPETAEQMHSTLWTPDPNVKGNAHGFLETNTNGYSGYGHGGDTIFFHSLMNIIPDLGLGIFASTNTTNGTQVISELQTLVIGRYFGNKAEPVPAPPTDFHERGQRFAGSYVGTRRSYTTVERLLMSANGPLQISATEDGYLQLSAGGQSSLWVETSPLTFRQVEGTQIIKFDEDSDGNIIGFPFYMPTTYLEKVGILGNPSIAFQILGLAIVVFVAALVGAWLRRKQNPGQSVGEKRAAILTLSMAASWVVWAIVTVAALGGGLADITLLIFDFPPPLFVTGLTIALLGAILTLASVASVYSVWATGNWSRWRRIRHSLVVVLGVATLLVLFDMNAIGYNYL